MASVTSLSICRRTSKALMNTCIRHACDKLSIDLRPCLQWLCFLEVHYQRPAVSVKPPAMETSEVSRHQLHPSLAETNEPRCFAVAVSLTLP